MLGIILIMLLAGLIPTAFILLIYEIVARRKIARR
jgi:hypothetical protein